jgi:methionine synthase I (cobalamin-dependent)
MDLLAELAERLVCGDGAMGTLLLDRGVPVDHCLEELCLSEPDRILAVHQEYVAAGARVIETNTFGANRVRLARFGLEDRTAEINKAAVRLARKATHGKEICAAGSVGPLGISSHEAEERGIDRSACFREQVTAPIEAEVDLMFFETFLNFEEMEIALRATPKSDCLNGPRAMVQLFEKLPAGDLLAAYPNAGYPRYTEGRYVYPTAPDYFAKAAREAAAQGARLIDGCCGTTPAHIAAVSKMLVDRRLGRSKSSCLVG